ncbi:MAG: PqqD family protein [Acidobacteriota bacterium]
MRTNEPLARSEGLLTELVGGELVVYDHRLKKAHRLSETAAFVWQHCNGQHNIAELEKLLASKLGASEPAREIVESAIEQLQKFHLLQQPDAMNRRALVGRLAVAASVSALVTTIALPTPARAASFGGGEDF